MNIREIKRNSNKFVFYFGLLFDRVQCGEYELSIQASPAHYSSPKGTFPLIGNYNEVEVAIIKNECFVDPNNFSPRPDWIELFTNGEVAPYVPLDVVQQIFDEIEQGKYKYVALENV
jgi:hypothetical protein